MKRFLDTCSILTDCSDLSDVVISSKTIEELENIKTGNRSDDIKYKARTAVRAIKKQKPEVVIVTLDTYERVKELGLEASNDNLIIASAYEYNLTRRANKGDEIVFYTEDYLCGLIAEKYFHLTVKSIKDESEDDVYMGYKLIRGGTDVFNTFMENVDLADWNINEYLIFENEDGTTKEMRFDGNGFVNLRLPSSKFIKAKNGLQRCALDMLMNSDITVAAVLGGYGSGKTYLSMQMALYNVNEKGNQSKILGVREVIGEGKEIGFLPGSLLEKTGNFFKPLEHSLQGGEYELERLMQQGILETNVPFFLKGTTYNQTIILCDEAEDLSESQIRLIGTRLGENSKIYLAGDYKQSQINKKADNPLLKMCREFRGNPKFACIYLGEDVRSETSKMFAELFNN